MHACRPCATTTSIILHTLLRASVGRPRRPRRGVFIELDEELHVTLANARVAPGATRAAPAARLCAPDAAQQRGAIRATCARAGEHETSSEPSKPATSPPRWPPCTRTCHTSESCSPTDAVSPCARAGCEPALTKSQQAVTYTARGPGPAWACVNELSVTIFPDPGGAYGDAAQHRARYRAARRTTIAKARPAGWRGSSYRPSCSRRHLPGRALGLQTSVSKAPAWSPRFRRASTLLINKASYFHVEARPSTHPADDAPGLDRLCVSRPAARGVVRAPSRDHRRLHEAMIGAWAPSRHRAAGREHIVGRALVRRSAGCRRWACLDVEIGRLV